MKIYCKVFLFLFVFFACQKNDKLIDNVEPLIVLTESSTRSSYNNDPPLISLVASGRNSNFTLKWNNPIYETGCEWYIIELRDINNNLIRKGSVYKNGSWSVYGSSELPFTAKITSTCIGKTLVTNHDLNKPDASKYTCSCRKRYLKFTAYFEKSGGSHVLSLNNVSTAYQREATSLFMAPKYYAIYRSDGYNWSAVDGGAIPVQYGNDTRYGFIPPFRVSLPLDNAIYGTNYILKLFGEECLNHDGHYYFFRFSVASDGIPSPYVSMLGDDPNNPIIPY